MKTARELAAYLIELFEGRRLKVYKDSSGYLTVGVGHKVVPADKLKLGDVITPDRCEALFQADLDKHSVATFTYDDLPPYQEAALWALRFNCPSAFRSATALRKELANLDWGNGRDEKRILAVANAIRLYNKGLDEKTGKKVTVAGLKKRREVEAHVFDLVVTLNAPAWGKAAFAIKAVQAWLFVLGFDPGPIDGDPGPKTKRALQAFQKSRGITPPHDFDADYINPLRDAVEEKGFKP